MDNRKLVCDIISEMLDTPDEHGIYSTTKCYDKLENILNQKDAKILKPKLTASEAVYGFVAWLTTRKEETIMGVAHECGRIVELIDIFCKTNSLAEPHEKWHEKLIHPKN